MRRTMGIILVAVSLLAVWGCEKSSVQHSSSSPSVSTRPASNLPSGLLLATAPANPQEIVAAKSKAKTGEEIVVRGKIGGQVKPFVEGRAIFQLVDSSLPTCNMTPGDTCETPWDYCCEPKDVLAAKSITVQLVGGDGKPLKMDLNGQGGLKPMAKVIVRGKVAERPDDKTLTVQADGLFVE